MSRNRNGKCFDIFPGYRSDAFVTKFEIIMSVPVCSIKHDLNNLICFGDGTSMVHCTDCQSKRIGRLENHRCIPSFLLVIFFYAISIQNFVASSAETVFLFWRSPTWCLKRRLSINHQSVNHLFLFFLVRFGLLPIRTSVFFLSSFCV